MGRTTVELEHIFKSYGERLLIRDFSYIFLKGDRIGFIGPNGSGKTTLMKLLDGRIEPDAGTITIGQTIKIGYYTQEIEEDERAGIAYMNPADKVIDYIRNTAEYVRTTEGLVSATTMLERFLFPSSQQYSPIGKLSGGEKRRLNLLRVLMEAPNVLILDEPTNDLDIQTLTILEDYLDSYEGIVIAVSHDRYFLDRVVRRIFAFEGDGEIRQYEGGYTDYRNRLEAEGRNPSQSGNNVSGGRTAGNGSSDSGAGKSGTQTTSRGSRTHEKKLKFTYKEQKEYETIEADITALEEKIEALDEEMLKNSSDFVRLNELTMEKENAEAALEEKMERWEYLEELAARIAGQDRSYLESSNGE
jgi:ATP-binding cassette subfamily F protein uup